MYYTLFYVLVHTDKKTALLGLFCTVNVQCTAAVWKYNK